MQKKPPSIVVNKECSGDEREKYSLIFTSAFFSTLSCALLEAGTGFSAAARARNCFFLLLTKNSAKWNSKGDTGGNAVAGINLFAGTDVPRDDAETAGALDEDKEGLLGLLLGPEELLEGTFRGGGLLSPSRGTLRISIIPCA